MQAICFLLVDFSEVTENYYISLVNRLVWLHESRFRTAEMSLLDLNDN